MKLNITLHIKKIINLKNSNIIKIKYIISNDNKWAAPFLGGYNKIPLFHLTKVDSKN